MPALCGICGNRVNETKLLVLLGVSRRLQVDVCVDCFAARPGRFRLPGKGHLTFKTTVHRDPARQRRCLKALARSRRNSKSRAQKGRD